MASISNKSILTRFYLSHFQALWDIEEFFGIDIFQPNDAVCNRSFTRKILDLLRKVENTHLTYSERFALITFLLGNCVAPWIVYQLFPHNLYNQKDIAHIQDIIIKIYNNHPSTANWFFYDLVTSRTIRLSDKETICKYRK